MKKYVESYIFAPIEKNVEIFNIINDSRFYWIKMFLNSQNNFSSEYEFTVTVALGQCSVDRRNSIYVLSDIYIYNLSNTSCCVFSYNFSILIFFCN